MDATLQLYNDLGSYLKNFIIKHIKNKEDAEDIFQEIFIKIHQKIHTVKEKEKIESWIFQIARNLIIDYYRKKKPMLEIHPDFHAINEEIDKAYENIEKGLRILIHQLDDKYKDPLLLYEVEELSLKEISEKLKISVPAVKSRLHRARVQFKEIVYNFCHFEFDSLGTVINAYPKECHICKKK